MNADKNANEIIKKNDFIELDFSARVKETGEVFDTTYKDEAKKLMHNADGEEEQEEKKAPIKICIGQGMVVHGFDKALEGKSAGKEYEIELLPKEAFGERDSKLVRIMPISVFHEREVEPAPGMMLSLDGIIVRISAVSSGRVIVDFNNPLAGKTLLYKFRINKTILDDKEKIACIIKYFLNYDKEIVYEKTAGKVIVKFKEEFPEKILSDLRKTIKELLNIDVEFVINKEKQKKTEEEQQEKEKQKSGKN